MGNPRQLARSRFDLSADVNGSQLGWYRATTASGSQAPQRAQVRRGTWAPVVEDLWNFIAEDGQVDASAQNSRVDIVHVGRKSCASTANCFVAGGWRNGRLRVLQRLAYSRPEGLKLLGKNAAYLTDLDGTLLRSSELRSTCLRVPS